MWPMTEATHGKIVVKTWQKGQCGIPCTSSDPGGSHFVSYSATFEGVDEAHETLSGPATQKILQREYYDFKDPRFVNLARVSVAHLYRLRETRDYRKRRVVCEPTRPSPVSIGERRRPDPQGRPGYLRVDTVHQGDKLDGSKGVYHINAVDEVTQWEVVGAAP